MNASAHLVTLFDVGSHAPRGSSSESRHVIHVHVRLSLSSPLSSSTSICPSPSSPFSSLMHFEQYTELDNLIAMQNLHTSANNWSNDAYDVSVSLTEKQWPRRQAPSTSALVLLGGSSTNSSFSFLQSLAPHPARSRKLAAVFQNGSTASAPPR